MLSGDLEKICKRVHKSYLCCQIERIQDKKGKFVFLTIDKYPDRNIALYTI